MSTKKSWLGKYILGGGDGHQVILCDDVLAWAAWYEASMKDERRQVGYAVIDERLEVSTVFLGLDQRFKREGEPILFETKLFRGGTGAETWRYASWDEAESGHRKVVSWLLNEGPKPE